MMNEVYEVELKNLTASFLPSPFDLVLGVEKQTTLKVDAGEHTHGFTDVEWQVIWSRVKMDDTYVYLPQRLYDELDDEHGEVIGERLWELTNQL